MNHLPFYISATFGLISLLTLLFLCLATSNKKTTLIISLAWLAIQGIIALTGFYTTITTPPRFIFMVAPPLLFIIILFCTVRGRRYIDNFELRTLTLLHIIRIPVEMVLFWLFVHKAIPQIMTFEGRNFDILSGITALLVYYFGFIKKRLPTNVILLWNFLCLGLLVNIVVIALLSAPTSFQQFGFGQPNIAIMYFPFVWLPCFVVPAVLFSHLVSIMRLIKSENNIES